MITRFVARVTGSVLIAPALIATALGAGVTLGAAAPASADADLFGAIVIDNAGNWWAASGQDSAETAEKQARSACGERKGCDVVITWKNGCAAVAKKGEDFDGETAVTREEAEHKVLEKLDGPDIFKNSEIVTSACNEDGPRVVSHDDHKAGEEGGEKGEDKPGDTPA